MLSSSKIKIIAVILFVVALFPITAALLSSTVKIFSFSLSENKTVDIVGEGTSLQSDGTNDAAFRLSLKGVGIVRRIQMKNLKTDKTWDTQPGETSDVLLVQDAGGNILNQNNTIPKVTFFFGVELNLWLNNVEVILADDATYQVTVTLFDNSTVTQKTDVDQRLFPQPKKKADLSTILFAQSLGESTVDIVGDSKEIGPSGRYNWHIATRIQANGIITGFRITNTVGQRGEWDTLPASESSAPLIAVTNAEQKLLTPSGGGWLNIPIDGTKVFHLWVEDNGTLGQPSTRSSLLVSMSDGRIMERAITSSSQSLYEMQIVSADFLGISNRDFVNTSTRPGGNLNPDLRLDVAIDGTGTLTHVQVQDLENLNHIWNTTADDKQWLVGVSFRDDSRLQNHSDGSIKLVLQGKKTLSLWFERKNPFPTSRRFKVSMVWDDGKTTEIETSVVSARGS